VVIALWLIAVWILASTDPLHERLMAAVFPDDTRFAPGYSEAAFSTVFVGESEDAVRTRLGEPVGESVFYMPKGSRFRSMMEAGPGSLASNCFGAHLAAGVVNDMFERDVCRSRGIVDGISKADVLRILGTPTESCAEYSASPTRGRFRMRMVCFLSGKVEMVFRRRI
jgi:hypothetical protein